MAQTASNKKERGKFLTVLLILGVIGFVTSLPSYVANQTMLSAQGVSFTSPVWSIVYNFISSIADAVALYGIWKWKLWGVYLWFVVWAAGLALLPYMAKQGFSNVPDLVQQGTIVYVYTLNIIGAVLWFWAIHRKWKYFA